MLSHGERNTPEKLASSRQPPPTEGAANRPSMPCAVALISDMPAVVLPGRLIVRPVDEQCHEDDIFGLNQIDAPAGFAREVPDVGVVLCRGRPGMPRTARDNTAGSNRFNVIITPRMGFFTLAMPIHIGRNPS